MNSLNSIEMKSTGGQSDEAYSDRIELIRNLLSNYQLLQGELHSATKKEILIERTIHFVSSLASWSNFGFTWFDPESGLFELQEIFIESERSSMNQFLDHLIEAGTFAAALQLYHATTYRIDEKMMMIVPIRAGHEIRGVFIGFTLEEMEVNREFEFSFLNLVMNSLGSALLRIASLDRLALHNGDLNVQLLKKIKSSEEAQLFAEISTRRLSDFFHLFHNEVFNSLNGVLGFTQLMMEETISDSQREHLEVILSSGNRLKGVSEQSQRLEMVTEGILSVHLKSIDFHLFWKNTALKMEPILKAKNRCVTWSHQVPSDFQISIDEVRLLQVIVSLVELIGQSSPQTPVRVHASDPASSGELSITFESSTFSRESTSLDFSLFASFSEILKLDRTLRSYPFTLCRSIAKFEGWVLELHEFTPNEQQVRLRINLSGRSIYE